MSSVDLRRLDNNSARAGSPRLNPGAVSDTAARRALIASALVTARGDGRPRGRLTDASRTKEAPTAAWPANAE
jgi:hypothetical protein